MSLVAPGVDLIGAMPFDVANRGTGRWSGTSFASPIISGGVALLLAVEPNLSADDLRERLQATAQRLDARNPGFAERLGAGRIDLTAALSGGG